MEYKVVTTITDKDIYKHYADVPFEIKGYKIIAFRPPKPGELFLSKFGWIDKVGDAFNEVEPRYILEKLQIVVDGNISFTCTVQDIYGKGLIEIPNGWEYVRFGIPIRHDKYISPHNISEICFAERDGGHPRIIVDTQGLS